MSNIWCWYNDTYIFNSNVSKSNFHFQLLHIVQIPFTQFTTYLFFHLESWREILDAVSPLPQNEQEKTVIALCVILNVPRSYEKVFHLTCVTPALQYDKLLFSIRENVVPLLYILHHQNRILYDQTNVGF